MLGPGDRDFIIYKLEPYFHLHAIEMRWSKSRKKWPDIWIEMRPDIERTNYGMVPVYIPVITVTAEWRRQSADERRKRLVHEAEHISGKQHGIYNGLSYNTFPEFDNYSKFIYKKIIGKNVKS